MSRYFIFYAHHRVSKVENLQGFENDVFFFGGGRVPTLCSTKLCTFQSELPGSR